MSRTHQQASPEDWRTHLIYIASKFSAQTYSDWYFDQYPQNFNRLYEDWLVASNLELRPRKMIADLHSERALIDTQLENWKALAKHKSNPLEFFRHATKYKGPHQFFGDDQVSIMSKRLISAADSLQDVDGFIEMLRYIDKRAKFLWAKPLYATGAQTWLDPLIRIWHRRGSWRRPLEKWRPKSHNRQRQFASLIRHLLADYDVPSFMDTVWLRNDKASARMRDIWVHLGQGKNIRKAKRLPMALTKKAAHILLSAPEELTFEHAFKWAHMQTFGLRPRLCAALLGSRWGLDFSEQGFWDSVLRFLSSNPMIAPDRIGPIIDYIYAQKFEGPILLIDGDKILRDDPPHPGFSMTNRQGTAILEQVEVWHAELARTTTRRGKGRRAMDDVYCKSGWKTVRETEKLNEVESAVWEFVEILNELELHEEGRKMRHCIYSYRDRISAGSCSIWSLRTCRLGGAHDGTIKRQLTVEVSANGRVNEARGFANALPTGRSEFLLRRWVDFNRMSFAPYVFL